MNSTNGSKELLSRKGVKELRKYLAENDQSKQNQNFWTESFKQKLKDLNISVDLSRSLSGLYKVTKVNNFLAIYFCDCPEDVAQEESSSYSMAAHCGGGVTWSPELIELLHMIYQTKYLVCFGGLGWREHPKNKPTYFNICPCAFCEDYYDKGRNMDDSQKENLVISNQQWEALLATDKKFAQLRREHFLAVDKIGDTIEKLNKQINDLKKQRHRELLVIK